MRVTAVFAALAALMLVLTAPSGSQSYAHLDPGGPVSVSEKVPVQFVFVGFGDEVNPAQFLSDLPAQYRPVVRSRLWYGVVEQVGINYTYDYKVVRPSAAWQDSLFASLAALSEPAPLTLYQQIYNSQRRNAQDVVANHFIDPSRVEKWLIDNPPPGVDTRRNTLFFINWYAKSGGPNGFRFHVYRKSGEPDPDTGFDFGTGRESRKIVAWGGTTPDDEETGLGARGVRRVWFYDLSAGPEAWGGSYNVDDHDIDGDGAADYRIPVIWEYGSYRPVAELSADLARVARYAAINLLFTPSPLYPPYITPDRHPDTFNLDLNTYEGWPGVNASQQYQTESLLVQEVGEVHRVPYDHDNQDVDFSGMAAECLTKWLNGAKCDSERPQYVAFANLYLYNALNITTAWDDAAKAPGQYESMFFNYATTANVGFLGYADDNWVDGTQSFTFNFVYPAVADFYGLTTTQIHEYGHHFGLSHPHDGYDWERGIDYGPSGSFFFAWLGDEVNSMMSYIDLNWDFSQFDRDNANRFQATAYVRAANNIAGQIEAAGKLSAAASELKKADDEIGRAKASLAAHDYAATFDHAKAAFGWALQAAVKAGVTVQRSEAGWFVLPPRREIKGPVKRDYAFVDRYTATSQRAKP